MRNFNNNRTILLKEYLPEALKGVREIDSIMDAENPELEALWQACEDCMNDQFIVEATENGIARRENLLGITPYSTDTLDDRRFRLLSRYMEDIPYTRRSLINMLTSLCGSDGYELVISTSKFTVSVKIALTAKKQVDSVRELLERILPYNMTFTVDLLYNNWGQIKAHTWNELMKLTWKEIKEEELSSGGIHNELQAEKAVV